MRPDRNANRLCTTSLAAMLLATMPFTLARATESGASVYPVGVETVLPGALPGPGQSILEEFNNFYQANGLMDGSGHNLLPGFHLRVAAVAAKFVHNWGVHAVGGTLVSSAAAPLLYEHLSAPFGAFHKTGLGNTSIGTYLAYKTGSWHWWYGVDGYLPGAEYKRNDALNVGRHNFGVAPAGSFTYIPNHVQTEISGRFQYIVNFTNPANQYRSGREFVSEYAAMRKVAGGLALGLNGYFYQQTSNDVQDGVICGGGNRGRALAVGPQARYHLSHALLILKYQREMLVQNRAVGNSFWLQVGVPLGSHE